MLPVWLHAAEEGRRLRASDAEFERVVSLGVGPLDTGTDEQEVRQGQGRRVFSGPSCEGLASFWNT